MSARDIAGQFGEDPDIDVVDAYVRAQRCKTHSMSSAGNADSHLLDNNHLANRTSECRTPETRPKSYTRHARVLVVSAVTPCYTLVQCHTVRPYSSVPA